MIFEVTKLRYTDYKIQSFTLLLTNNGAKHLPLNHILHHNYFESNQRYCIKATVIFGKVMVKKCFANDYLGYDMKCISSHSTLIDTSDNLENTYST